MELTDWRGNTYREGSRVIYAAMSGRSVELQEATVLEIKTVYQDPDKYKWVKLEEGQEIPRKPLWNFDTNSYDYIGDPVRTEMRVKLQPEGRGSRDFSIREDTKRSYVNKHTGEEVDWKYINKTYYEPVTVEAFKEHGKSGFADYRKAYEAMERDGWEHKETYVKPKPVTLMVINNITVI